VIRKPGIGVGAQVCRLGTRAGYYALAILGVGDFATVYPVGLKVDVVLWSFIIRIGSEDPHQKRTSGDEDRLDATLAGRAGGQRCEGEEDQDHARRDPYS
jgi:hypothetical protein